MFMWREYINVLRGVAVLLVILSHVELIHGGFIGVDVFFVISGFVVTLSILKSIIKKQFNPFTFWMNRIYRLLPVFTIVITSTLFFAQYYSSPLQIQKTISDVGISSVFMSSNLVINKVSHGYFSQTALWNPLLHLWSLSIEEQFYVCLPILISIILILSYKTKTNTKIFLILTSLTLLGSWSLHTSLTRESIKYNDYELLGYYGSLNRAWEFIIGCILAIIITLINTKQHNKKPQPTQNKKQTLKTITSMLLLSIGWIGIILSGILINRNITYPGYLVLYPVISTTLIIIGHETLNNTKQSSQKTTQEHETNPTTHPSLTQQKTLPKLKQPKKLLNPLNFTIKIISWIGLLSYSLYLWHWPIIVFTRSISTGNITTLYTHALPITLLLSITTYYLIEKPIQSYYKNTIKNNPQQKATTQ